ncbi:MAG: mobile mystery protein A [Bacteroidales bacterium]|nr:mobile mystery protein A [Bacteroidales bacterium]
MNKRAIIRNQLDDKMVMLQNAGGVIPPASGWIYAIRYAINMSLRQLGQRLSITPQSVKEIEEREKHGTISLKVLRRVATALNMRFVYGFIPEDQTLEGMIEKRATELAEMILDRASIQMSLEDQKVSEDRINRAVDQKAREFKEKVPKMLWD